MVKQMLWFFRISKDYLNCNTIEFILRGGIAKAYKHAKDIKEWDNLTDEQREKWYLSTQDRVIDFQLCL